jgi:hypothetical protein
MSDTNLEAECERIAEYALRSLECNSQSQVEFNVSSAFLEFIRTRVDAARLEEAKWWRHLSIVDQESYFAVEGDNRIAELERQSIAGKP